MGRTARYSDAEITAFAKKITGYLEKHKMVQVALNDSDGKPHPRHLYPSWPDLEKMFEFTPGCRARIRLDCETRCKPLLCDSAGVRIAGGMDVKALAIKRRIKDSGTRVRNIGREATAKGREELKRLVNELEKNEEGELVLQTLPKLLLAFDNTKVLADELRKLLPPPK